MLLTLLNGRQLPGVVCRLGQGGREPHRTVPVGRVQETLQGERRGFVGLIPVGGSPVQRRDEAGFDAAEFAEQELPEQRVVPVPVPLAVQGITNRPTASRRRNCPAAPEGHSIASHSGPYS